MDDDAPSAPPAAKPSQVPSWITLGFALGALFVMALPRPRELARPAAPAPAPALRPAPAPQLTTIEAVFEQWQQYAVWSGETTQVAMWNSVTQGYSDCYEVLRVGDNLYFRSIPALTRPILTHGVVPESPLQFTESAAARQQWLGDVRQENWRQFSQGVHDSLAPARATPAVPVPAVAPPAAEPPPGVAKPDNPK